MMRHMILVCCSAIAFLTLATQPTVKREHASGIPKFDMHLTDNAETVSFIRTYLTHGFQFDPAQNAN